MKFVVTSVAGAFPATGFGDSHPSYLHAAVELVGPGDDRITLKVPFERAPKLGAEFDVYVMSDRGDTFGYGDPDYR